MCVDWIFLTKDTVQVGDTVSADAGGMPTYKVVKLDAGQAWLQDELHGAVMQAPLDKFRWKVASAG